MPVIRCGSEQEAIPNGHRWRTLRVEALSCTAGSIESLRFVCERLFATGSVDARVGVLQRASMKKGARGALVPALRARLRYAIALIAWASRDFVRDARFLWTIFLSATRSITACDALS